jgi:prophage regulatory protein
MAQVIDKHTDHILRLPKVRLITGLSRSSIYALQVAKAFPHSVKLSDRAVGWLESEVRGWLQHRAQQRDHSLSEDAQTAEMHSPAATQRRAVVRRLSR